MIVGTVTQIDTSEPLSDGFLSSLVVAADEVLKGPSTLREAIIRQRSGILPDGSELIVTTDLTAQIGERLLLFLSKEDYQYQASQRGGAAGGPGQYFVLHAAYRIVGEDLRPVNAVVPAPGGLAAARQQVPDVASKMR